METWNQMVGDDVRRHTLTSRNRRIDARVERRVCRLVQGDREALARRLERLERGWDLERVVTVGASAVVLLGLARAARSRRTDRASLRAASVAAGLLLHQGLMRFGPLAALVRWLGVRTRREMDLEKFALKALRGDFARIPHEGGPLARVNAALVASQA